MRFMHTLAAIVAALTLVVIAVALVYVAIDIHALVVDMRSPFEAPWTNSIPHEGNRL